MEQGVKLDVKGVRRVAYRYAERARVLQRAGQMSLAEGDTVQGRRVVVSADGGRLRLRENKRGAKTKKGRTRYRGAWREPKLLIIYVVDAHGKLETSFAPLIDGHLQGPEALFQLLEGYLHALAIDRADHVLFVADGAHWLWNRIPKLDIFAYPPNRHIPAFSRLNVAVLEPWLIVQQWLSYQSVADVYRTHNGQKNSHAATPLARPA